MYPVGHWQVLFGMQTPIPHEGSQITVGNVVTSVEDLQMEWNDISWSGHTQYYVRVLWVHDNGK